MQIKLRTLLFALPLLAASCSDAIDSPDRAPRMINVTVGSNPGIDIQSDTRTALESDGETVRWNTGDKIALWARNAEGTMPIAGTSFDLWHYNETFNAAKFTGDVQALPEGTYIYYATSPIPEAISGTTAQFSIPAVQEFKTAELGSELTPLPYDVMVADPVEAGALVEGDNSDVVNLRFRHKVHLLKITVESNSLNEKVSEVEILFPQPVVGTLSVDVANPTAAPVLTNSSNKLVIRFDQPVAPGTTVIAAIAPVNIPATQHIQILSLGETCESIVRDIPGKNFAAGHTTPIFYNIPGRGKSFTIITVCLQDIGLSTLGEEVETLTLTAPAGSTFDNGSNVRAFQTNNQIELPMRFRVFPDNLSNKKIDVVYESEHAILSDSFTMPTLVAEANNALTALQVPYLMTEDFSSLNTNTGNTDNPKVGGTDIVNGDRDGIDLSSWGLSTSGWIGARIGVAAGKAVRICARVENQSLAKNTYRARIDSPPFSKLKANKTVDVKVSYNFKGGRYSMLRKFNGKDDGPGNGNAVYSFGSTTTAGWQAGSVDIPDAVGVNVAIPNTSGSDRNSNQNYDNINQFNSYTITAATNMHRASWMVSSTMDSAPFWGANGNFWLYLDNIKVSIAN